MFDVTVTLTECEARQAVLGLRNRIALLTQAGDQVPDCTRQSQIKIEEAIKHELTK